MNVRKTLRWIEEYLRLRQKTSVILTPNHLVRSRTEPHGVNYLGIRHPDAEVDVRVHIGRVTEE